MGFESHEQLDIIQASVRVLHHKRLKYVCPCYGKQIVTASKPAQQVDKTPQSNSYMWLLRSAQSTCAAVLYRYEPTRSGKAAVELLCDYRGALMVDGYSGYNAVCEQQSITRLGCWAHARRKFIDAQKIQKAGKTGKALQKIKIWLDKSLSHAPPQSLIGKALHYLHEQ